MITKVVLVPHLALSPEQLELCREYIQSKSEELLFETGDFIHAIIDEDNPTHVVLYIRRMEPTYKFYGNLSSDAEIDVDQYDPLNPPPNFRQLKPSLATQIPVEEKDEAEEPESEPQLEQESITFLAEIGDKDTIDIPSEYMDQHGLEIGEIVHVTLKKRD